MIKKSKLIRFSAALLDQGFFAGFSFVVSVLLARWMSPEGFGAYSYAFSIFLLVAGVHNAFVIEPLNIFGPGRYRELFYGYVVTTNKIHWIFSGCFTFITLFVTFILWIKDYQSILLEAFVGLGLSQGFVLFFWLQRRTQYAQGKLRTAALGTILAGASLLAGITCLKAIGLLTPCYVFLILAVSSFAAGLFLRFLTFDKFSTFKSPIATWDVVRENLGYCKWLIVSMALYWLTTSSYQVMIGSLMSLSDAAAFRALQNISSPIIQITTAMGLVFMPWLSSRYNESGKIGLVKGIWLFTLLGGIFSFVYLIIMWAIAKPVFNIIYGYKYSSQSWLAPYYCIWPLIPAITSGWLIGLRVLEKNIEIFKVDLLGAVLTVTLGIWLVYKYGIVGAIGGTILSACGRIVILPVIWRHALVGHINPKKCLLKS